MMMSKRIFPTMHVSKVALRTEPYPGYLPGYHPTRKRNLCTFCRTFIPAPGTSGSSTSVRHSYPYPKLLQVLYARGHNTRGTVTAFLYLPGTSVSSVRPCHNTRNFCEFCKTVAQYPGYGYTFVTIPAVVGTD